MAAPAAELRCWWCWWWWPPPVGATRTWNGMGTTAAGRAKEQASIKRCRPAEAGNCAYRVPKNSLLCFPHLGDGCAEHTPDPGWPCGGPAVLLANPAAELGSTSLHGEHHDYWDRAWAVTVRDLRCVGATAAILPSGKRAHGEPQKLPCGARNGRDCRGAGVWMNEGVREKILTVVSQWSAG